MDENHLQKWANSCGFQPPFLPYTPPDLERGNLHSILTKDVFSPRVYNLYNLCLTTNRSPGFVSEVGTSQIHGVSRHVPFFEITRGYTRQTKKNAVTSSPRKTYSLKLIDIPVDQMLICLVSNYLDLFKVDLFIIVTRIQIQVAAVALCCLEPILRSNPIVDDQCLSRIVAA